MVENQALKERAKAFKKIADENEVFSPSFMAS